MNRARLASLQKSHTAYMYDSYIWLLLLRISLYEQNLIIQPKFLSEDCQKYLNWLKPSAIIQVGFLTFYCAPDVIAKQLPPNKHNAFLRTIHLEKHNDTASRHLPKSPPYCLTG